jgi:predicted regulator of Ras-like GTPase activity (Roadblock/LC7/MglB family)
MDRESELDHPYTLENLERDLTGLQMALEARCAFVADEAGQVVSVYPAHTSVNVAVLGALAVANLSATQQIVQVVAGREQNDQQLLIVETPSGGVLLCRSTNGLSLIVVLDKDNPLGLARLLIQQMTRRLSHLIFAPIPLEPERYDEFDLTDDILGQLDQLLS